MKARVRPLKTLARGGARKISRRQGFGPTLVIMVKEPKAGKVKTRLARGIGTASAVCLYRTMLGALVARLSSDPRWRTVLAVSPDAALHSRAFAGQTARMRQGEGDLGRKLQSVADRAPPGPLVIIGTDIPGIRAAHIAAAFRALGNRDAVFGPASDGGYWLVGLRRMSGTPRAFHNVCWSSEYARADTMANLKGRRLAEINVLDDVDDASDLRRLGHLVGRRVLPRDA